jgi:hypothetical protein
MTRLPDLDCIINGPEWSKDDHITVFCDLDHDRNAVMLELPDCTLRISAEDLLSLAYVVDTQLREEDAGGDYNNVAYNAGYQYAAGYHD